MILCGFTVRLKHIEKDVGAFELISLLLAKLLQV